jgi:hypothetical protein
VSRNRELSLENPADISSFSKPEQLIYKYIKDISKGNIHPATIELEYSGKTVNANSVINVQIDERVYSNSATINIKKNRRTKQWEIEHDANVYNCFNEISPNDADYFYMEFEELLYSNPAFTSIKKGRYRVEFEILDFRITCEMDNKMLGEEILNYSFGFTSLNRIKPETWISILTGVGSAMIIAICVLQTGITY